MNKKTALIQSAAHADKSYQEPSPRHLICVGHMHVLFLRQYSLYLVSLLVQDASTGMFSGQDISISERCEQIRLESFLERGVLHAYIRIR